MIVYRLEDKNGEGPFCHKDGTVRINPEIKFDCKWLYAFDDVSCFKRPSYRCFLYDDEFTLYEIEISHEIGPRGFDTHEVIFWPGHIVSKKKYEPRIDVNDELHI